MKMRKAPWVLVASMAVVVGLVSTALAIEAFQERFEWGDLSKPTTLRGRVAVVDPYDKAAWVNVAVFGGNAESGYYWQKYYPGKTLKVYPANDNIWNQLKSLGKDSQSQAVMTNTHASKYTQIEFVVQETNQNHRVVTSVKTVQDDAGTPSHPVSYASLRSTPIETMMDQNSWPQARAMLYDVLLPDGTPIVGTIPNSNQKPHAVSK